MSRLIDAEILFEKVGNIKPKNKSEYELLGKFMNMITNSTTVERPHEWVEHERAEEVEGLLISNYECSKCHSWKRSASDFCPNCGALMQASYRQVTGKLDSETEYKAKVKELEDAIARCDRAEKEFKSRTCKFRSPTNCDFCSFHSDCDEHWKEGDEK